MPIKTPPRASIAFLFFHRPRIMQRNELETLCARLVTPSLEPGLCGVQPASAASQERAAGHDFDSQVKGFSRKQIPASLSVAPAELGGGWSQSPSPCSWPPAPAQVRGVGTRKGLETRWVSQHSPITSLVSP
jgi:hypothetical protein